MRTTIIPAQITTVEDKIAGSLNMTQILILMFPVLWTALIYILFAPVMKLAPYKLGLIGAVIAICLILIIRIKDKIVADWLGVVLRYQFRPKYWLYNKNDITNRIIDIPDIPDIAVIKRKTTKKVSIDQKTEINICDLVRLEQLIDSGKVAVRYQMKN
ncbi:MAG: hypothetical protein KCHDKBKB_03060 [Elusimicrobia bacterium]|nr:hypothetical protein [Elusimicrobiota bacterium]